MPGKSRSGLANDRRAYGCGIICYTPTPTVCLPVAINIASIATYVEGNYILNGNYTITECQILNIPGGTSLFIISGQTLTNSGTINISGTISNFDGGIINNQGGGIINNNSGGIIDNVGTFNNSGIINNNSGGITSNIGTFDNSGTFNNRGTFFNDLGGFIYTYGGGTINNNTGGIVDNILMSFIYTYGGGTFNNSGTISNGGSTISTSNGGTCGAGTFTGTAPLGGTINTNCPP